MPSGKMREQRLAELGEQVDVPALELARLEEQVSRLTTALASSRVISTAVGLVMERFGLDRAAAQAHLVGLSQNANQKLVLVAEELVRDADCGASG